MLEELREAYGTECMCRTYISQIHIDVVLNSHPHSHLFSHQRPQEGLVPQVESQWYSYIPR